MAAVAAARRVVVVTGANRGLGLEMVRQIGQGLARGDGNGAGTTVCMAGRDLAKLERAAAEVQAAGGVGGRFHPMALDVASAASIDAFVAALERDFGRCDVLINNAGVYDGDWTAEDFDRVIGVNVRGLVRLAGGVLPLMCASEDGGLVVNMSSGLGDYGALDEAVRRVLNPRSLDPQGAEPLLPLERAAALAFEDFAEARLEGSYKPVYAISKCLVNICTQALQNRADEASSKVTVAAVDPGWCRTDMGGQMAPRAPAKGAATPAWLALLPPGDERLAAVRGRLLKDKQVARR